MRIAFFHKDIWPPVEGSSIQSWQLYSRLRKHHDILTTDTCPFPDANHAYRNIYDAGHMLQSVDLVFIIVDGPFYFFEEKFSFLSSLLLTKRPVVWLLNAPIEESLLSPRYNRYRFLMEKLKRKYFSSFVDVCMCVSSVMDAYARENLMAKKYIVVPNGSDPTYLLPRRRLKDQGKINQKKFNIIWAGSGQYPWQALDVIDHVARILVKRDPNIMITLLVDNPWYTFSRLPNLHIVASKDYFHIRSAFQSMDMALCLYHKVLPLGFYNSPLKLFDAMSMGVPVIATDIGQIHDVIVDRHNGYLTNNAPEEVVSIIESAKHDSVTLRRIGQNARKTITKYYNWDRMVQNIEDVFHGLVPYSY